MTLKEYLNQQDAQRMPEVILTENDIAIQAKYKVGVDMLTLVTINGLWEKFGVSRPYLKINNESALYTTDNDGNKKSLSCFRLP